MRNLSLTSVIGDVRSDGDGKTSGQSMTFDSWRQAIRCDLGQGGRSGRSTVNGHVNGGCPKFISFLLPHGLREHVARVLLTAMLAPDVEGLAWRSAGHESNFITVLSEIVVSNVALNNLPVADVLNTV